MRGWQRRGNVPIDWGRRLWWSGRSDDWRSLGSRPTPENTHICPLHLGRRGAAARVSNGVCFGHGSGPFERSLQGCGAHGFNRNRNGRNAVVRIEASIDTDGITTRRGLGVTCSVTCSVTWLVSVCAVEKRLAVRFQKCGVAGGKHAALGTHFQSQSTHNRRLCSLNVLSSLR